MAHAFRYLIRALASMALAFGIFRAHAQPASASPSTQSVRFTVFSAQRLTDIAFRPRADAQPQSLRFQPTARSKRYEYRGPMPLRFVDDSGAVVAEAMIPIGMTEALLLFSPLEPGKADLSGFRYQIAVLDDSMLRQGPGGLAIINLSGLGLSGAVNKENVSLKPGLNPTVSVGSAARVVLTTRFKNRTYQSYASTFTLKPSERALLILFPPFNAGGVEVQSRLLIDSPGGADRARFR